MNCKETRLLFSAQVDGELDTSRRAGVDAHLKTCEACRGELSSMQRALASLKEHGPVTASDDFEKKLLARLRSTQRTEPIPTGGSQKGTARFLRFRTPAWVPLAAAALLLIVFTPIVIVMSGSIGESTAEIERLTAELRETRAAKPTAPPPARPEVKPPPAPGPTAEEVIEDFVREHGLVREGEAWMPEGLAKNLREGRAYVDGTWIEPADLASRFRPETPPAPMPAPRRSESEIIREWLRINGYVQHQGAWVPQDLARALGKPGKAAPDRVIEEFMKERDLVQFEGRVMHRERMEELQFARTIQPPDASDSSVTFDKLVTGLKIGLPVTHGGISVYPISGRAVSNIEFAGLSDLEASLIDGGHSFKVKIRNPLKQPMFIPAGTLLTGGHFARITRNDVVLPVNGTTEVAVYDAQPDGLTSKRRFNKGTGGFVAPTAFRPHLQSRHGQTEVWTLATRLLEKMPPPNRNPSIEDLYRAEGMEEQIGTLRKAFDGFLSNHPEMRGVAIASGDRVVVVQIFESPGLLRSNFDPLLAAAALEAALVSRGVALDTQVPNAFHELRRFIQEAYRAKFEAGPGGYRLTRDGRMIGELAMDGSRGAPVAVTLFPHTDGIDIQALLDTTALITTRKVERFIFDLMRLIKDEPAGIKEAWLAELSTIGGNRATREIQKLTRVRDEAVRMAAVDALGLRADPTAIPDLVTVFKSERNPKNLNRMAKALARFGDSRAVDAMTDGLSSPEPKFSAEILPWIPSAIRGLDSRTAIEKAMVDLLGFFEFCFSAYWRPPEGVTEEQRMRFRVSYAQALECLLKLTGQEFRDGPEPRQWWTQNKDAFIQQILK